MAHYIDTSALVKLVVAEPETEALLHWLTEDSREPVACDLARTELMRAVRRAAPDRAVRARQVLDTLTLLQLTPSLCERAGRLEPAELRSLDALHLVAALNLEDELQGFVTYDTRLAHAAQSAGITVLNPGRQ